MSFVGSFFSALFGKPKERTKTDIARETPPAPPKTPTPADAEEEARKASLARRKRRARFGKTILTSSQGAPVPKEQTALKTLLGE